jgi:hypothetical protein
MVKVVAKVMALRRVGNRLATTPSGVTNGVRHFVRRRGAHCGSFETAEVPGCLVSGAGATAKDGV